MAESAALLVDDVLPEQPMRQWVLSVPYQLRFLLAISPVIMGRVLGIVYRVIATHLIKKAGQSHKTARAGAVTLIQRLGSALNLNIHFHMVFLDGVYADRPDGSARFRCVRSPTNAKFTQPAQTIARCVGRFFVLIPLQAVVSKSSNTRLSVYGNEASRHERTWTAAVGPGWPAFNPSAHRLVGWRVRKGRRA